MDSWLNPAAMYGMYPNSYYNQVAMNDLTNMNLSYPTGMAMDPMMSMNGSLFGSQMGMMNPYMPAFCGGGNYENYYKNYEEYQNFMIDSQLRQQQRIRNADLKLNSPQEGIQKQAELLHEKILQNEQEQIQIAYNSFINSVKGMYGDATKEQIDNRAETLYKQLTGSTIYDDIRKNSNGSFTQGFLQTVTLGLADKKTAEENISQLTGLPVGRGEQTKKTVGNILGGATLGGTVFLATGPLMKALKITSKSKTFWGMIAGALVGIGATFATSKS